jgi:demethylmenaquinone methyltransferase/2-methoxy-6-polyprenyl-1,4-benzoquinol methylase
MKVEDLGNSKIWNLLFKPSGLIMGSGLRKWIFNPIKTLQGADVKPGQTILEVGCGTGFFTIPAAHIIGEQGSIVALDLMVGFLEEVSKKVQTAELNNVKVVKGNALDTGLDDGSMDKVLLFGVLPFPSLPLDSLLPEMHRILKPDGSIAVWMFPVTGWVPNSIHKSDYFELINKKNGVHNFRRL